MSPSLLSSFPTASNTVELANFVARLQTEFREYIPSWIASYSLPYNLTVEGQLAPAGVNELYGIGKRAREHATELPAAFSSDKYVLQHTFKSRTKESAKAYVPVAVMDGAAECQVCHLSAYL